MRIKKSFDSAHGTHIKTKGRGEGFEFDNRKGLLTGGHASSSIWQRHVGNCDRQHISYCSRRRCLKLEFTKLTSVGSSTVIYCFR